MEKEKETFICTEFKIMSINGAFQRNSQYLKNPKPSESKKKDFRKKLKEKLDEISEDYKEKGVINEEKDEIDKKHIENIKKLITLSETYKEIFQKGKINFGTAQKLLNLYLKYLWIAELIEIPPHCPFDYNILKELKLKNNWTELESPEKYKTWVNKAREEARKKSKDNIAEWELDLFNKEREKLN